ncbi:4-alpha-glucanotransferase [Candidatus Sumerlaeota bacterium]|nr:4-alpha-glucanotransferase [Candidatus Sumerlaeota bacterium]
MSLDRRLAGVLLHPTSLPGRFGIGDLGPECYRFLDWMRDAGLAYWQVLPLGPTSFGDSPYQCFSAFAGNPLLVSPEELVHDEFLAPFDITPPIDVNTARVDYGPVIEWKTVVLRRAFNNFSNNKKHPKAKAFAAFQKRKEIVTWLDDYALFRVCKDLHGGRAWSEWQAPLRKRTASALEKVMKENQENFVFHKFCQFLFFLQWDRVREACRMRGITIIGDAPIYVAYDSADTWAHQNLFDLDKNGHPVAVAGVPPDYFSATGQLWGNPLYDWKALKGDGYRWWIDRLAAVFAAVDLVRLDHFRGFMGYWAVPFGEQTAVNGKWQRGPGADLFKALQKAFKDLPIIAEDLGEITPDVIEVRDQFKLPGMNILQFAWGAASVNPLVPDPGSHFTPHQHVRNSVVYTGTHDNDTTVGWWRNSSAPQERHHMQVYLSTDGSLANWDLIRAAFASVANSAIIPMQDFLGLDSDARMNFPGKAEGNWAWRMKGGDAKSQLASQIRALTLLYQRCSNPPESALPKADPKKINYLANAK